ncbi:MAG: M24 family metallopeptidase [Desulfosudaceae bacterium]
MDEIISSRLRRLRDNFPAAGIEALLVMSDENRHYLSGFTGQDGACDETAGALLITPDRLILATDGRYLTQAESEADGYEVICYTRGLAAELPSLLGNPDSLRLGVEARRLTLETSRKICDQWKATETGIALEPMDETLDRLRARKDERELARIKEALVLAENVFENFLAEELRPGITEKRAAWLLEKRLREAGADALSFPVIAAFSDNSARPHAVCGEQHLKKNRPILFDWGVVVKAYCSDISRSFVWGRADQDYQKVHETVYAAQQEAIAAIKPGVEARAVDKAARTVIERAGYGDYFSHGLGHGVGLAIHEAPRVSSISPAVLEEGMVFTVEPGIYLPGWGGVRLENMVVVRAGGAEVLNRTNSDLMEIP